MIADKGNTQLTDVVPFEADNSFIYKLSKHKKIMTNIDFASLQAKQGISASSVAKVQTIYSRFTPKSEPFPLVLSEVESVEVVNDLYEDSTPVVQQPSGYRRSSPLAMQVNLLLNQNNKSENKAPDLRLKIVYNATAGKNAGNAYIKLADEMKPAIESKVLHEGLKINPADVALQLFQHPEFDDIILAFVNLANYQQAPANQQAAPQQPAQAPAQQGNGWN